MKRKTVILTPLPEELRRSVMPALLALDSVHDIYQAADHAELAALIHRFPNALVLMDLETRDASKAATVKALLESITLHQPQKLTPTYLEILRLIALGHSVKEIAAMRFNSEFTISTHKKNIFSKLGVNNAHDATKYALRTGIIDLVDYYI